MTFTKTIILIVFLSVAVLSCMQKHETETTRNHRSEADIDYYDSDIHRIVRYAIAEWDSIFPENDIDIISVETLSTDTFHWICVYAIPCYFSFSDTIPGQYPILYTLIDNKLIRLIIDDFMIERNKQTLDFVNPCDYPKYKVCEGDFNYDPIALYFCFMKDSLVFRHKGFILPDSIRYHP